MTQHDPETQTPSAFMRQLLAEIQGIACPNLRKAVSDVALGLTELADNTPDFACSLIISDDQQSALLLTGLPGLKGAPDGKAFVDVDRQRVFIACGAGGTCSGYCSDPEQVREIAKVLALSKPVRNPTLPPNALKL